MHSTQCQRTTLLMYPLQLPEALSPGLAYSALHHGLCILPLVFLSLHTALSSRDIGMKAFQQLSPLSPLDKGPYCEGLAPFVLVLHKTRTEDPIVGHCFNKPWWECNPAMMSLSLLNLLSHPFWDNFSKHTPLCYWMNCIIRRNYRS